MEIREIQKQDRPGLAALWQGVFCDPPACAEEFLRFLPEMGSGAAALENGRPVGAAYIVTGLHLREGEKSRRCGYLYAVAVDPAWRGRGLGAELSRAAATLGRVRGAELIGTWPAEPALYAWYERILGMRCALHLSFLGYDSAPGPVVRPLDPEEYGRRREALLAGLPHLFLEPAAMAFEARNLGIYGGGLYAVGAGLAAAFIDGGTTQVRELLGMPPEAAAAVGAALGTARARLWQPAESGEPFLAFSPAELPSGTVWNLAFD
ncbi:MAG: GNAT family N-acetyltransferase [Clostridia bacterium]